MAVVYISSLVSVIPIVGMVRRAVFTSASISSDDTLSMSWGSHRSFGNVSNLSLETIIISLVDAFVIVRGSFSSTVLFCQGLAHHFHTLTALSIRSCKPETGREDPPDSRYNIRGF